MTDRMQEIIERERQLRITASQFGIDPNALIVWRFVAKYVNQHGYSPSFTEMADECFLTNPSIQRALDRLTVKGIIKRPDKQRARAIEVLRRPPMAQEAQR